MAGAITDFSGITADVLKERASPDLETSNLVKGPLSSFAAELAAGLRKKIEKGNVTLSELRSVPGLQTPDEVRDLAGRCIGGTSVFERLVKDLEHLREAEKARKRAERDVRSLEDELANLRGGKREERKRAVPPEEGSGEGPHAGGGSSDGGKESPGKGGAEQKAPETSEEGRGGRRHLSFGGPAGPRDASQSPADAGDEAPDSGKNGEKKESSVRSAMRELLAVAETPPAKVGPAAKQQASPDDAQAAVGNEQQGGEEPAGSDGDAPAGRRVILSGRELSEMESEIGKRLQDLKEAQEKERDALQERLREAESGSSPPRERSIMKSLARARSRLRNSEISAEAAAAVASGTAEQVKSALHETLLSRETEKERKFSEYFRSEVEARAERLRKDVATARYLGLSPRLFACTDQGAQVEYALRKFEAPGFRLRGKDAEPPAESNVFLAYLRIVSGNREVGAIFRKLGRQVGFDDRNSRELADGDPSRSYSGRTAEDRRDRLGGITLGGSIQRALPVELARLSIPETEILFEQSWLEGRLMSFDFDGTCRTFESSSSQRLGERLSRGDMRGPVIVLVDTSSSMRGFPEDVAKACAMTMALRCRQENRACHIIKFSSVISEYRMKKGSRTQDLAAFLGKSFRGGTDIDSGLLAAVRILENDPEFIKADLICCTDGWFKVGKDVQQKMSMLRKRRRVRFYELITGIQISQDRQNFDEVYCFNFRRMETQRNKVQPLTMMGAGGFGMRPGTGMRKPWQ